MAVLVMAIHTPAVMAIHTPAVMAIHMEQVKYFERLSSGILSFTTTRGSYDFGGKWKVVA